MVQQDVAFLDCLNHVRFHRGFSFVQEAGRAADCPWIPQIRALNLGQRAKAAQIQRGRQSENLGVINTKLTHEQRSDFFRHFFVDFEANRRTKAPTQKFLLEGLQNVLRIVLFNLEVFVAGHTERVVLHDFHAGEEHVELRRDDLFKRHEAYLFRWIVRRRVNADQARQYIGHLDAGKQVFSGLWVLDQNSKVERQARDIWERVRGIHRERGQDREDLLGEPVPQAVML